MPLHPEGRALTGPPPRQEEGASGVLAEAGGEHGRPAERPHDELLNLVGLEDQLRLRRCLVRFGESHDDAVVRPQHLDVDRVLLLQASLHRHGPRCVDAAAEWAQQADPPVAQLVAEAFDHDRAIAGERAGRLPLVG